MTTPTRVLLIDDDDDFRETVEDGLAQRGYAVTAAPSAAKALELLGEQDDFAVVLSDITMDGMTGIELCTRVHERREHLPVVLMTAYGTVDAAIAAIRAGAYDFVTKPFPIDALALVLERARRLHELETEVERLRKSGGARTDGTRALLGDSTPMKKMLDVVERVAESVATVLVTGESGTGKELVARSIHNASPRRSGKFVAVNCAAVPEPLLESELFGHARGAFTDARIAREGLFVSAHGGTLFMDEIGDMPMGMQAKLLRALQERTIRPVGSNQEIPFDARIVAATHRDLESLVEQGTFREDLFYRINVVRVHVPPLRARGNDILVLAAHFIRSFTAGSTRGTMGMSSAVAERFLSYPWPGNVRELQNAVERAVAVARGDTIALEDLPDRVRDYAPTRLDIAPVDADPQTMPTMEQVEERYIRQVLTATGGNKTLAAQILGYDRRTLYRKVERMEAREPAKS